MYELEKVLQKEGMTAVTIDECNSYHMVMVAIGKEQWYFEVRPEWKECWRAYYVSQGVGRPYREDSYTWSKLEKIKIALYCRVERKEGGKLEKCFYSTGDMEEFDNCDDAAQYIENLITK